MGQSPSAPTPHPQPTATPSPQPRPTESGISPNSTPTPSPTPVPSPAHQATPRRTGHPTGGATPNPHPTVNVRLNTVDWGFSGIDPAQMEAFEKALARAQDTLGTNEPRIRHALEALNLDTSHLAVLRETRQWIAGKRPELRRRNETIQAVRERWSPGTVPATGLTPFDEGLYARAARNADAYAAAQALGRAAQSGKIDQSVLAELEKRADDADFATALMYALGATGFRTVLATTGKGTDRAAAQRLQAALGKALAAASPRLDAAWRAELTAKGSEGQHYWLSRALMHGTYDAAFLVDVARKIEAAHRDPVLDPLPGVLTALSRVPAAAQDFFARDPGLLNRLMNERRTLDDGKALSAALLAATTVFRDHAGTPGNPSRGYLSAKLASEIISLEAQRLKNDQPLRLTPDALGRLFAAYILDINRVAKSNTDQFIGVAAEDHPGLPGQEPFGARFVTADLRAVMKEVFKQDSDAFKVVSAAQTVWASKLFDAAAARVAAGESSEVFTVAAEEIGTGFGFISDAASVAAIQEGQELDEAQERNVKIISAVVNSGLAIPQNAAWPIVAGWSGAWSGLIEDSLKGDNKEKSIEKANSTADEIHLLVRQLAVQAMLNHHLFGPHDPPGKHHPWASLSGLEKGDDPRKAPNNFLKEDGKTLLTLKEMLESKGEGGRGAAYDAYRRWLDAGLAGKAWGDVRRALDSAYSQGFAKFR